MTEFIFVLHFNSKEYFYCVSLSVCSCAVKEDVQSRSAVHGCLGEVLRVLRQVISTYPLLNTVETLTAAGTLISKVKGQFNRHQKWHNTHLK